MSAGVRLGPDPEWSPCVTPGARSNSTDLRSSDMRYPPLCRGVHRRWEGAIAMVANGNPKIEIKSNGNKKLKATADDGTMVRILVAEPPPP